MIPQKDIRFVQQKAFKLLSEGKSVEDVQQLIAQEGGNEEQIQFLSEKYLADYAFLKKETHKRNGQQSSTYYLAGSVILLAGLSLLVLSYLSTEGRGAVFHWGLLVTGLILIGRGYSLKPSG